MVTLPVFISYTAPVVLSFSSLRIKGLLFTNFTASIAAPGTLCATLATRPFFNLVRQNLLSESPKGYVVNFVGVARGDLLQTIMKGILRNLSCTAICTTVRIRLGISFSGYVLLVCLIRRTSFKPSNWSRNMRSSILRSMLPPALRTIKAS